MVNRRTNKAANDAVSTVSEKRTSGRGRQALTGTALAAHVTKELFETGTLSHHWRKRAAEEGLISFLVYRKPGTRGRVSLMPVLSPKGAQFFKENEKEIVRSLKAA